VDERNYFGEDIAARYDVSESAEFQPDVIEATVDVLARLAGDGRVLELAIGTGRIALPLARRGVPVHGIDKSEAMVARLRAKPGHEAVSVTMGDFSTAKAEGTFSLVYLVFNTIMNLTTQEAQVACFRNAAAQLEPGGCFLIEVGVPGLRSLPPGQRAIPFEVSGSGYAFDLVDVASQATSSNYFTKREDGTWDFYTIPFRYAWPAEFDLMAQMAGLRLRDRWGDWSGEPFTNESTKHISVWEKPLP
jgi:SAM-dependent methyltransferase